jgi:hypothetical protein
MSSFDILSPHVHIIPIPRTYIITNINMVRSVDLAKFQKLVRVVRFAPHLCTRDAMRTAKYSNDEIADLSFWRLLQRRLRGGSLDSFRAIVRLSGGATRDTTAGWAYPPSRARAYPPPHRATPTSGRRSRGTSARANPTSGRRTCRSGATAQMHRVAQDTTAR